MAVTVPAPSTPMAGARPRPSLWAVVQGCPGARRPGPDAGTLRPRHGCSAVPRDGYCRTSGARVKCCAWVGNVLDWSPFRCRRPGVLSRHECCTRTSGHGGKRGPDQQHDPHDRKGLDVLEGVRERARHFSNRPAGALAHGERALARTFRVSPGATDLSTSRRASGEMPAKR